MQTPLITMSRFKVASLQIQVRLAEECQFQAPGANNDNIKDIEISTLDSISNIIDLAVKSWNPKRLSNMDASENACRQQEYVLTIENGNGKEHCYEYLNETNRKNLGTGKQNILVLRYSPKAKALSIIQHLMCEFKTMKEKGETKEDATEDPTKRSSTSSDGILPLSVLDLFRTLACYTEHPDVANNIIELEGFELLKDFLYLPLFRLPLNEDERRRGSDISPSPLVKKSSTREMFPNVTETKSPIKSKPSIVVHEEIPVDNVSNIVMCLSYMLESMAALVSADPNVLLAEGPKIGYQISQFLNIDENYYALLDAPPTISKSCSYLLTSIAQMFKKDGSMLNVTNEQPWFRINALLALHKRPYKHQINSIECFISVYSLSSKYLKQEMVKSFNEYQLKNRKAFLGKGKFSVTRF